MSRLRMLCEQYIQIDDDLNKLNYRMDNLDSNPQKSELIARYIKKFVEREDFKSGMRRYLVNELLQGVGVNENEKRKIDLARVKRNLKKQYNNPRYCDFYTPVQLEEIAKELGMDINKLKTRDIWDVPPVTEKHS